MNNNNNQKMKHPLFFLLFNGPIRKRKSDMLRIINISIHIWSAYLMKILLNVISENCVPYTPKNLANLGGVSFSHWAFFGNGFRLCSNQLLFRDSSRSRMNLRKMRNFQNIYRVQIFIQWNIWCHYKHIYTPNLSNSSSMTKWNKPFSYCIHTKSIHKHIHAIWIALNMWGKTTLISLSIFARMNNWALINTHDVCVCVCVIWNEKMNERWYNGFEWVSVYFNDGLTFCGALWRIICGTRFFYHRATSDEQKSSQRKIGGLFKLANATNFVR